ncbi:hypothetical protein NL509_27830, partial [Klebsiella pneumoniae]|nr:hypothetical protein [Klebsiella pneumoniae]
QKSPLLKLTPAGNYKPVIRNARTSEIILLSRSLLNMQTSNFHEGRMELFTFEAPADRYLLELEPGSGLSGIQHRLAAALSSGSID